MSTLTDFKESIRNFLIDNSSWKDACIRVEKELSADELRKITRRDSWVKNWFEESDGRWSIKTVIKKSLIYLMIESARRKEVKPENFVSWCKDHLDKEEAKPEKEKFKEGDKVLILKKADKTIVGWAPGMSEYIGKKAVVKITNFSDVSVKLDIDNQSWNWPFESLIKIYEFKPGDKVKIVRKVDYAWTPSMCRIMEEHKNIYVTIDKKCSGADDGYYKIIQDDNDLAWPEACFEPWTDKKPTKQPGQEKEITKKAAMNGIPGQLKLDLGMDLGKVIAEAITGFMNDNSGKVIDENIKSRVKEEVNKLRPIVIKVADKQDVEVKGKKHKKFEQVLLLANQERQVMIVGPAGSGKTTLARQIAESLNMNYAHISCSAGMSEAHLMGRMLFNGEYASSDFVNLYEKGGLFLMDEIDAADANTLLVVNSAIANGRMSVPNRKDKPYASRHKDFILFCAGNSWGHGSMEYHGRGYLDAAFLDRFTLSRVEIDYDVDLERDIADSHNCLEIAEMFWTIRKKVKENNIRRPVSTRAIVSGIRLYKADKTKTEIIEIFTTGWNDEEKSKINSEEAPF